jgi:hypothetical protein
MKDELRNYDQLNLDILGEVVTKYNAKPHTSTKYSPSYLWELLLLKYYNGAENDKKSIVSLYFEVKENLDKYQSNYVNYQNRKRKYAIKIGQLVYNIEYDDFVCKVDKVKENRFVELRNFDTIDGKNGENQVRH